MLIPRWRVRLWWYRTANLWMDTKAVLRGACNQSPYRRNPLGGGGYPHWRCELRRHHTGPHRYNNYTWGDDCLVAYTPVPTPEVLHTGRRAQHPPDQRHSVRTIRQERAHKRTMRDKHGRRRRKW